MTQLPAPFLHTQARRSGTSLFIQAIQEMLNDVGNITSWNDYTPKQAPFPLETIGLLTLMQWADYDPNARLSYEKWTEKGKAKVTLSLLEAVLMLATHAKPVGTQRTWPTSLEDMAKLSPFDDLLSKKTGLSAEFLAATLLASGADPWADVSPEDPLGRVLPLALMNHMGGLAERIWQCEHGRPPAEALGTAAPWGENKKAITTWLDWVTAEYHGASTAAWLLGKGVALDPKNHPLSMAQNGEVVKAYVESGIVLDTKVQNKLIVAWQGHVNRQTLSSAGFVSLKQALSALSDASTSSLTAEEERTIAAITKEYGEVAWGKDDPIHWGGFYRENKNKRASADGLEKRVTITLGALQGQWNPFVSWLFRHIRSGNFSQWTLEWLFQKPTQARPRGWLAHTIGFDWRPGISINGLLGFALALAQPMDAKDNHKERFEDILHALGIDDFESWITEQHVPMVAFSQAFSRGNNAKEKWLNNWQIVFNRNPHLRKAWPGFLLSLRALAPIYNLEPTKGQPENINFGDQVFAFRGNAFSRWWVMTNHREGDTYRPPLPDGIPLTEDGTSELIETVLVLGTDHPQWWEALETRAAQGLLNKTHKGRIQCLIDDLAKAEEASKGSPAPVSQKARERLKGILLAASLPQASPEAKRARF